MQILDVVNEMLGTMGEAPLASLEDPHAFRGAAVNTLTKQNRVTQARGWWFNTEILTLSPMLNGRISLAGDCISVRNADRTIAQRGRYLYNLTEDAYTFTNPVDVELVRLVNFEELPETAADYIATQAVRKFQLKYDGDTVKARALQDDEFRAFGIMNTEHIRNRRANFVDSNTRLQRIKSTINGARRFIR